MSELKKVEAAQRQLSPSEMMQAALNSGTSLESLEKMMELQERWEKNEAKKAYVRAMTAFKADPPRIDKDKNVAFGNTKYDHASLSNVTDKINSALSKHGLSSAWSTKQENNILSVTCTITHEMGHSESTTLSSAYDNSGGKNSIQAIGSANSYLQRYTILSLTGLATHDQDNDGKALDFVSPEQAKSITNGLRAKKVNIPKFLKFMGAETVESIPAGDYDKAMSNIARAKGEA